MTQPQIVKRPWLAQWLFDRNMSVRDGALFFETTAETLRRAVLPFGDPNFRVPYPQLMRRIIERTAGAVRADHWFERELAE